MQFFKLVLKLLSPAIIVERKTRTGFLKCLDYIPAPMLRGAILSAFYRNGKVSYEFLKGSEALSVIASPAYPVGDIGESYPCHPFAYRCKICGEVKNYVADVLSKLERGEKPNYRQLCDKGHAALESLHPKPYIPSGNSLKNVGILTHGAICVGISKYKASAERGMLFEYEAIATGHRFWTTIMLPDKLANLLEPGLELYVGRGISRGFGKAQITSVKEVELKDVIERTLSHTVNNRIVLYALSPLLSCREREYSPYPRELDLSDVATKAGLNAHGKLVIEAVYGKTSSYAAGWDMIRNKERPTFNSATNPGAIAIAKFKGESEALAILSFTGTIEQYSDSTITGVNMLTPMKGHPMAGE